MRYNGPRTDTSDMQEGSISLYDYYRTNEIGNNMKFLLEGEYRYMYKSANTRFQLRAWGIVYLDLHLDLLFDVVNVGYIPTFVITL